MADECERQTPFCGIGIVELDESYFGAKRIRGKRGRGAGGKTIVFGILKRGQGLLPKSLPMLQEQLYKRSSEGISLLRASSILMDSAAIRSLSIWASRRHRLVQFNSVLKYTFYLYLKETEFQFNQRHDDL